MAENDRGTIDMGLLDAIGRGIQYLRDSEQVYTPSQMEAAIRGGKPVGTINIAQNGQVDVTQYASANVQVPGPVIQPITATQNGTYTPPAGVDGFGPVTVQVSGGGGGVTLVVGVAISGGYNGGAQLSIVTDADTVTCTGDSPYNENYTPSSGTIQSYAKPISFSIATRAGSAGRGAYVDITLSDGTSSSVITCQSKGNNGSYGFDTKNWAKI